MQDGQNLLLPSDSAWSSYPENGFSWLINLACFVFSLFENLGHGVTLAPAEQAVIMGLQKFFLQLKDQPKISYLGSFQEFAMSYDVRVTSSILVQIVIVSLKFRNSKIRINMK